MFIILLLFWAHVLGLTTIPSNPIPSDFMRQNILSFRKTFFAHIQEAKEVTNEALLEAFSFVGNETNIFAAFIKFEIDKTENAAFKTLYLQQYESLGTKTVDGFEIFDKDLHNIVKSFNAAFLDSATKSIIQEFELLFTKANAESFKYRRYTGMQTDPKYMLQQDLNFKTWMYTYDPETLITSLNIPGTFNSLSTIDDELYQGLDAVQILKRTQNLTLEEQFEYGVRAFDFQVSYYTIDITDKWDKLKYYYCDLDLMKCYNFRFYNDVFPLTNKNMTTILGELQSLIKTNPSEFIHMRLSCVPDFFCKTDLIMNKLIDNFFFSFQETNGDPMAAPVLSIDQYTGYKIKDFMGRVVVTFRHFPFGYQRDFWDLCSIGPEILPSIWTTYGTDKYYYELDKQEAADSWRYADPANVVPQTIERWAAKVNGINRYGQQYEWRVSDAITNNFGMVYPNECHDYHTYHMESNSLPPLAFKQALDILHLYDMHASRFLVGTVYMDFLTKRDIASLMIRHVHYGFSDQFHLPNSRVYDESLSYKVFKTPCVAKSEVNGEQVQVYGYSNDGLYYLAIKDTANEIFASYKKSNHALVSRLFLKTDGVRDQDQSCVLTHYQMIISPSYNDMDTYYSNCEPSWKSGAVDSDNTYKSSYSSDSLNKQGFVYMKEGLLGLRLKIFKSGTVVVWDQFCHVWNDNYGKPKILGTKNEYDIIWSTTELSKLMTVKENSKCYLRLYIFKDGSFPSSPNLEMISATTYSSSDKCLMIMSSNGNLVLGPLVLEYKAPENPESLEYQCFFMQLTDEGNIVTYYGPSEEIYWSMNDGSYQLLIPTLEEGAKFQEGMARNRSVTNGFFKMTASNSGPGSLILQRSDGKQGSQLTTVIEYKAVQGSYQNNVFYWQLSAGCLFGLYFTGSSNPLYSATPVNMYYGQNSNSQLANDDPGNCLLEITEWGDIIIYRKKNKGVDQGKKFYNMVLQNSIKVHLLELAQDPPIASDKLTFKDAIYELSTTPISMSEQQLWLKSPNGLFFICINTNGRLHLLYTKSSQTCYNNFYDYLTLWMSEQPAGSAPYTLIASKDGLVVKDSSDQGWTRTIDAPYNTAKYLLLANDGSLMFYKEDGTVVHSITQYQEGLNLMFLNYYSTVFTYPSSIYTFHKQLKLQNPDDIPHTLYENAFYYMTQSSTSQAYKSWLCGGYVLTGDVSAYSTITSYGPTIPAYDGCISLLRSPNRQPRTTQNPFNSYYYFAIQPNGHYYITSSRALFDYSKISFLGSLRRSGDQLNSTTTNCNQRYTYISLVPLVDVAIRTMTSFAGTLPNQETSKYVQMFSDINMINCKTNHFMMTDDGNLIRYNYFAGCMHPVYNIQGLDMSTLPTRSVGIGNYTVLSSTGLYTPHPYPNYSSYYIPIDHIQVTELYSATNDQYGSPNGQKIYLFYYYKGEGGSCCTYYMKSRLYFFTEDFCQVEKSIESIFSIDLTFAGTYKNAPSMFFYNGYTSYFNFIGNSANHVQLYTVGVLNTSPTRNTFASWMMFGDAREKYDIPKTGTLKFQLDASGLTLMDSYQRKALYMANEQWKFDQPQFSRGEMHENLAKHDPTNFPIGYLMSSKTDMDMTTSGIGSGIVRWMRSLNSDKIVMSLCATDKMVWLQIGEACNKDNIQYMVKRWASSSYQINVKFYNPTTTLSKFEVTTSAGTELFSMSRTKQAEESTILFLDVYCIIGIRVLVSGTTTLLRDTYTNYHVIFKLLSAMYYYEFYENICTNSGTQYLKNFREKHYIPAIHTRQTSKCYYYNNEYGYQLMY